ncbi:hypothetical protein COLO4_05477 [Corchorus olitorius]|uniref:Uncharacterized protein n=1 Tax=Corchorus olitorius TaxID=93759 RepID=A0A1R3KQY4_9ROSI|nr:hypothetical protein COLO4_05477 [Corchorus olitorius]
MKGGATAIANDPFNQSDRSQNPVHLKERGRG